MILACTKRLFSLEQPLKTSQLVVCLENSFSVLYIRVTTVANSYDALRETFLSFLLSFILLTDFENKTSVRERWRSIRTSLKREKKKCSHYFPTPTPLRWQSTNPLEFCFHMHTSWCLKRKIEGLWTGHARPELIFKVRSHTIHQLKQSTYFIFSVFFIT